MKKTLRNQQPANCTESRRGSSGDCSLRLCIRKIERSTWESVGDADTAARFGLDAESGWDVYMDEQPQDVTVQISAELAQVALVCMRTSVSNHTAQEAAPPFVTSTDVTRIPRATAFSNEDITCSVNDDSINDLLSKPDLFSPRISSCAIVTNERICPSTITGPSSAASEEGALAVAEGDEKTANNGGKTEELIRDNRNVEDNVVSDGYENNDSEAAFIPFLPSSCLDPLPNATIIGIVSCNNGAQTIAFSENNDVATLAVRSNHADDDNATNDPNYDQDIPAEGSLIIDLPAEKDANEAAPGTLVDTQSNASSEHVVSHNAEKQNERDDTNSASTLSAKVEVQRSVYDRACYSAPPTLGAELQILSIRAPLLRSLSDDRHCAFQSLDVCDDMDGVSQKDTIVMSSLPAYSAIKTEVSEQDAREEPLDSTQPAENDASSPAMNEPRAGHCSHHSGSPHSRSSLGGLPLLASYANVEVSVVESPLVFGGDAVDNHFVENERLIERHCVKDLVHPNFACMPLAVALDQTSMPVSSGRRSAPPRIPATGAFQSNHFSFSRFDSASGFNTVHAQILAVNDTSPASPHASSVAPSVEEAPVRVSAAETPPRAVIEPYRRAFHNPIPVPVIAAQPTTPNESVIVPHTAQGKRRDSFSGQVQPPLKKRYQFDAASELPLANGDVVQVSPEVDTHVTLQQRNHHITSPKRNSHGVSMSGTAAPLPIASLQDEGFRAVKPSAELSHMVRSISGAAADKRGLAASMISATDLPLSKNAERRSSTGNALFSYAQQQPLVQTHFNGLPNKHGDDQNSKLLTGIMSGFVPYATADQGLSALASASSIQSQGGSQVNAVAVAAAALSQQYQLIQEIRSLPQGELFHLALSGWDWFQLDSIRLPCVFRGGEKYLAVHMVQMRLLAKFPLQVPGDLMRKHRMLSHKMSVLEAWIFNTVNAVQSKYDYGYQLFSPSDEVVKAADVEGFYWAVKTFNLNRMVDIYRNEIRANADLHLVLTAHISSLKSQAETELRYYLNQDRVDTSAVLASTIPKTAAVSTLSAYAATSANHGSNSASGSRMRENRFVVQQTVPVTSQAVLQSCLMQQVAARRPPESVSPPIYLPAVAAERARVIAAYNNSFTQVQTPMLFSTKPASNAGSIHQGISSAAVASAALVGHSSAFASALTNHVRLPYAVMSDGARSLHGSHVSLSPVAQRRM